MEKVKPQGIYKRKRKCYRCTRWKSIPAYRSVCKNCLEELGEIEAKAIMKRLKEKEEAEIINPARYHSSKFIVGVD